MLATMTEAGCTARVTRLRERVLDTLPSVCAERGLLVTEAHKKYAADPTVLRRAKALAQVLDQMTIRIDEGELIVGNQASAPRAVPLFPEYEADFLVNEIDGFAHRRADVYTVSADVKRAILEEIRPYWHGNTLWDHAQAMRPAEVTQAEKIGAISGRGNISSGDGHIIMNIAKVLRQGLAGVLDEVRAASAAVSPYDAVDLKKRIFYQAAEISLEAAIRFARRYVAEAARQAIAATHAVRKAELERIAEVCERVPALPPRNFQEAVQSAWFVHLVSQIESNGHSFSLGRFDQYTYPFYQADLAAGRITTEQAQELLELLWLERARTPQEQKIADDYFPVLRIDSDKIQEVMPPDVLKKYKELQQAVNQAGGGGGGRRGGSALTAFWTVEIDHAKELEKSYILTSGDPERPEKDKPVEPGWPFAPAKIDFREGRIEAFSDWLTAPENPMFARVAVNRLWQWHFGEGIEKNPSDFGKLGGLPSNPALLDWLATEFVHRKFSMKEMHRLMVTSATYKMASEADPVAAAANIKADPENAFLWHYRVQRLEAEPVWDSILSAAGNLDVTVGGPSFSVGNTGGRRGGGRGMAAAPAAANRRGVYMIRGFSTSAEVTPNFLQAFDVDDGRVPCPLRTQTVTAPQGLFLMNSEEVESASGKLADRLKKESAGDLKAAVELGYKLTLGRAPSAPERDRALTYIENDPDRLKGFAWLLFNMDEFIYVR